MDLAELLVLAVGLSMDAFAVAVSKGLSLRTITVKDMMIVGLWFGLFQGLMPLIGYLLGTYSGAFIHHYSSWIAFILLTLIGINMIREAYGEEEESDSSLSFKTMFILAIATSIDALAVGVSLALLEVNILESVIIIGITTFIISAIGVKIGSIFGAKYKSKAEIAGGVILILLGVRIIIDYLLR